MTEIAAPIEVQVLDIDKENRRLSLGHKQLEENPGMCLKPSSHRFHPRRNHRGTARQGAVISLPYGVEGFATPKHLVKEDNSQAQVDEKLQFKVIEFNKDSKRIIVSHSRIHEDLSGDDSRRRSKRGGRKEGGNETVVAMPSVEKTTLGDIEELAALKEKLDNQKVEAFKKEAAKAEAKAEAKTEVETKADAKEDVKKDEKPKAAKAEKAEKAEEADATEAEGTDASEEVKE